MFAVMRETDYYNNPLFRKNFWSDWRKLLGKKHVIQTLDDCDFTPIYEWHLEKKQVTRQRDFLFFFFSLYDCIDVNYSYIFFHLIMCRRIKRKKRKNRSRKRSICGLL